MSMTSTSTNPYLVYGFYFLFALWVTGTWFNTADAPLRSFEPPDGSGLTALVDGSAPRPYVQRALVPTVIRTVREVLPAGSADAISASLAGIGKIRKESERLLLRTDRLFDAALLFLLSLMSVFIALIALRSLIVRLYHGNPRNLAFFPMLVFLTLQPFFFSGPHYPYDLPAVMFFILGLALMVRRSWRWYYPLFLLGCLNKETMALLTVPFIVLFMNEMPARSFKNHLVLHVLIGGGVTAFLWNVFGRNPGSGLEFHLHANVHHLLSGYSFADLMTASAAAVALLYGWRTAPPMLRSIAAAAVPYLLLWTLFGLFYEPRAIYEVIILAGIFLVQAIFRILASLNIIPTTPQ